MTRNLRLTTRVNIEVVGIVLFLMFVVTVYSQWISLEDAQKTHIQHIKSITDYIIKKIPDKSFYDILEQRGVAGAAAQDQVMAINEELQPILTSVWIPGDIIKFGIYSRENESIVAIGPNLDRSLLVHMDPGDFSEMYATAKPTLNEVKNSLVWYGAEAICYRVPIQHNDKIIGHVFAVVNMNRLYADIWRRTIYMLLGELVAILVAIMMFQEIFIRLKKDLTLFANELIKGRARQFQSELPELTPILQYISEQTDKMARLDRLNIIGEIAASIGHEVRNPMTTVRGFLQYMLIKKDFNGFKEQLQLMIEELDRANSIITEFLSLAKDHVMTFEKLDLNKVIEEIMPLLQADAIRNNCEVDVKLKAVKDVLLDKKSIRQLILNMVRNAIDAMPDGGHIVIATSLSDSHVVLEIKDTGVGIPDNILKSLGTPFITTKESGTGLGLAICYRIIQRHNATIQVKSMRGEGTSFIIRFDQAG